LVAEIGGVIIGTLQHAQHQEHVHIIGLAVHPEFQRRGVARALVREVVARAPTLDRDVVVVDTIRETGNVAVFERMGFRTYSEEVARWCASDDFGVVHEVKLELRCDQCNGGIE